MEVSTSGELSAPVVACIIVGGLILVCLAVIAVVSFQRLVSKKRRLDKQDNMAMRSNFDESQIDSSMLDHHSTADGPSRYYPPYSKHPPKSPVPVLSLRHYESDTASTVKTDLSIKTDSDTNFHMYGRPTSDSIDSYRPSPHGDVYRNMTSPSYTPHTRASHTFSDTLTASHRTNDFSFSTQFSRVSSMSTFRAYSSNLLLRNSDDLSVYSDRSDGTIF
ncbi:hypothetical protein DYB37_007974 [Aphanomyces astaci]|uniref:Uncharacterized protein n=2 Tax=Aphanomyces astaci TaxID=112090 RepID=A0A397CLT3_APHAT|nr:hypothetical protein DYB25_006820 [Aphanomyces astaci]RHY42603.1 hypothetical protein DYB38_009056 [Aphanomyces astaci]RHY49004.1 hypothetical protein DYB30_011244 [Aphanomyces astaci]RHY67508.1 hypothetical protein DYB34_009305 [Aphanomyces astaci]RHY97654.1 hypothetical protein DYB35_005101 [Aphanomyces astaci]